MTNAWFYYMFFAAALVAAGILCLLIMRNLIKLLIGVAVIGKGVSLALLASGAARGAVLSAQSLVITFIVVEVSLLATALALAVNASRTTESLDIRALTKLKW